VTPPLARVWRATLLQQNAAPALRNVPFKN